MGKRHESDQQTLEWRESKRTKRLDELRRGDQILATLRWEGWFSKRAFAHSPEGAWEFDRPKPLSKDVKVWAMGSDEPLAVLTFGWLGGNGSMKLSDGRKLRWEATNFWATDWAFRTRSGEMLTHFVDNSGFVERRTLVEIRSGALTPVDRDLLLLLGRYLMVLQAEDSAAAAAAAAASAAS
ncbi:MAG: hypothetical protein PVI59_00790 [Anaerolineae bacterium]